ncbi:MAG: hypothetical protein K8W52_25695 [Deltaproteobacteria bacterium]|nr:hypothetical protein [Deltaproteobacteria bacterium]
MRCVLVLAMLAASAGRAAAGACTDAVAGAIVDTTDAELRDEVTAVTAHVVVMGHQDFLPDAAAVERHAVAVPDTVRVEPFVFFDGTIRGPAGEQAIAIKGVDPHRVANVLGLGAHLVAGSLAGLDGGHPGIWLGDRIAAHLQVAIGDDVALTVTGKVVHFRVLALFHFVQIDEYNQQLAIVGLRAASPWRPAGAVSGVEITLDHRERATAVAAGLARDLGGEPFVVQTWEQLNQILMTALLQSRTLREGAIARALALGPWAGCS